MRKKSRYFLNGSMIALMLLQSGCGAIQLWWHAPNNEKEYWTEWIECPHKPSSSTGIQHPIFCLKDANSKPPVLLLHEMNGLTKQTLHYATELSKDFTVYIPMLFGEKGEESFWKGSLAYWLGDEWRIPSSGSAPIVAWLRDVVSMIEADHKSSPIRIIGNCMTGALPLALLGKADGEVNVNIDAVVVAQPSLPKRFFWWHTAEDHKSLGLSNGDLVVAQKSRAKVLALRFETDWISHPKKQETLHSSEFGDRLLDAEICARDYQPEGALVRAHSTLIGEYDSVGKVRALSKKTRETVRNFLLHPTSTAIGNSRCSSK